MLNNLKSGHIVQHRDGRIHEVTEVSYHYGYINVWEVSKYTSHDIDTGKVLADGEPSPNDIIRVFDVDTIQQLVKEHNL